MREVTETTGLHKLDASEIRDPEMLERIRDTQYWLATNVHSLILLTVLVMVVLPALNISSVLLPLVYPEILISQFWFVPYVFIRWLTVYRIRETELTFLKLSFIFDLLACFAASGIGCMQLLAFILDNAILQIPVIFACLTWPFMIIWNLFLLGEPRKRGVEIRALIYFPFFLFGWVLVFYYAYHYGWMPSLHGLI